MAVDRIGSGFFDIGIEKLEPALLADRERKLRTWDKLK